MSSVNDRILKKRKVIIFFILFFFSLSISTIVWHNYLIYHIVKTLLSKDNSLMAVEKFIWLFKLDMYKKSALVTVTFNNEKILLEDNILDMFFTPRISIEKLMGKLKQGDFSKKEMAMVYCIEPKYPDNVIRFTKEAKKLLPEDAFPLDTDCEKVLKRKQKTVKTSIPATDNINGRETSVLLRTLVSQSINPGFVTVTFDHKKILLEYNFLNMFFIPNLSKETLMKKLRRGDFSEKAQLTVCCVEPKYPDNVLRFITEANKILPEATLFVGDKCERILKENVKIVPEILTVDCGKLKFWGKNRDYNK